MTTHLSLLYALAAKSAPPCDCCKRPTVHRVAIYAPGAPVTMLCAACYAAYDFDAVQA